MAKFITRKTCDRCVSSLDGGRIMSMFNTDCICMICREREKHDKSLKVDHEQIRKGNYNFKGIRGAK